MKFGVRFFLELFIVTVICALIPDLAFVGIGWVITTSIREFLK